jgi:hypothetical protein
MEVHELRDLTVLEILSKMCDTYQIWFKQGKNNTRFVHVEFLVDKVALEKVFPSTSVFPCQCHSTGAPLQGKKKKANHLHHTVAQ